jgi:hypothetical protein
VEKRLGKKSDFAHSKTTHGHEAHSEGEVEQAVSLMTAQDVAELADEEIIILHRNRKPIRAKRLDFGIFPSWPGSRRHRLLRCRHFLSQSPYPTFLLTSRNQTNSVPKHPLAHLHDSLPPCSFRSKGSCGIFSPVERRKNHPRRRPRAALLTSTRQGGLP